VECKGDDAGFYPGEKQVMDNHLEDCARAKQLQTMRPARPPEGQVLTTGQAAPSRLCSRSVLGGGALHMAVLKDLQTSATPLIGAVIGGSIIASSFRPHPHPMGSLNAVFKADDGGVSRLLLYNLPEAMEAQLTPGRAVVVWNPWFKRLRDSWPGLRVDNPGDLILDLSTEEVVAMARSGAAADPMLAAMAAKEASTQHFRAGRHARAMEAYTKAIAILFQDGEVPITDFGLAEVETHPPALRSDNAEAVPLAVTLLTNRAAAALKLDRPIRALADTRAALAFEILVEQRAKVVYRRAEALIKVGAFDVAQVVIEPFTTGRPGHKDLAQQATKAAAVILNNVPMADGHLLGRDGAFMGQIALRHLGGWKGRGLVATQRLEAGTLLLVEPALVSDPRNDDENLTLQTKVLNCIGRSGDSKCTFLDSLACMHPLLGEVEDTANMRDRLVIPRVQELATRAKVPLGDALHIDKIVQRNQHGLCSWWNGDQQDFGCGRFPLTSAFNHSCYPNAAWSPVKGGLTRHVSDAWR